MLDRSKKTRKYSSVSFDGEAKKADAGVAEAPDIEEIEKDVNETEETVGTDSASEEISVGKVENTEKEGVEAEVPPLKDEVENPAKVIKSKIDLDNERKVKQILDLDRRHELNYSELLSAFVILFDNFCKMRDEYNRFRNSMRTQMRINSYNGQRGFAPSWN